jgi:hypothetical protein
MINAVITLHRKDKTKPINLKTLSENILKVCPDLNALVIEKVEERKTPILVITDEDTWIPEDELKRLLQLMKVNQGELVESD